MHSLSLLGIFILNIMGASITGTTDTEQILDDCVSFKNKKDDNSAQGNLNRMDHTLYTLLAEKVFSSKLMPVVAKTESSNYVFSPFSSFLSLYMVAHGARASTAETLKTYFGLSSCSRDHVGGLAVLIDDFNGNRSGVELRVANSLFFSSKVHIRTDFILAIRDRFRAIVQEVDFEKINETNNIITEWGKNQTSNRIINSGNVTTDAVLCLMNTVTFKSTWLQKFIALETKQRTFYVDGVTKKHVPTMSIEGLFYHGELSGIAATFVQLPFKTTDNSRYNMSMIIILPKARDGVVNFEKNFVDRNIGGHYFANGHVDKIYIELPKFKISSKIDMKEVITGVPGLNHNSLFNPREATFTGISKDIPIFLNHLVQNSFIEIDEEGCEAVATTASGFTSSTNSTSFIADHPFYALIVAKNIALSGTTFLQFFTVRFNG